MAADVQEPSSSKQDLDADQIQNLISMALSNAYDTVSSWLQPPSAAVIAADERLRTSNHEFEKMVFRPARLGVGATAPTSSTPKDVYKLKHKLAGTKRKADEMDLGKGKGKAKQDSEEDDDEESKSQSVSKKPKLGGASSLLAFEPTEPGAKHKKKKKKKHKGLLDLGTMASPIIDAASQSEDPGPSRSAARTIESVPSGPKQAQERESVPETSREGSMTERAEPPTGPVKPEGLPSDIREKKRKKRKKKRKSALGGHDSKSEVPAISNGNIGRDGDQGGGKDDGDEWLGISPTPPPPGSDMDALNPTIPAPTGDVPKPSDPALKKIPIRYYTGPVNLTPLTPPPERHLDLYPAESAPLPTLPNGDSPPPHKKNKKKRHHLLTQAQALDEQSSEATLVSSSDHTARMTSPRE